jgi:Transposase DDE domain group 1
LWPDWRHFAFITNRTEDTTIVEAEHRDHAVVEQVIADLKDQALAHFPSGEFNANGAWTVLGALAHNLLRWTQLIGLPDTTVRAARTLRRRLLQISGRLTRHGRSWTLHLPARWPWHGDYISALARIRAPPPPDPRRRQPHQRSAGSSPAGLDQRRAKTPPTGPAQPHRRAPDHAAALTTGPTKSSPSQRPASRPPTQPIGGFELIPEVMSRPDAT